jgi:hypothetical protein
MVASMRRPTFLTVAAIAYVIGCSRDVQKAVAGRFSHSSWASAGLKRRVGTGQSACVPMLPAPFQFLIAMVAYAIN